jgi:hypothetical protein
VIALVSMSADWKFAAHEGYLTWTLPALPSGGQRLYSKLTPTLLSGQLQPDDVFPIDYVDIPSIRDINLRSSTSIQVDRHTGESHLFVADTADEARTWFDNLRRAMRNSEHYQSSHAVQTSPVNPPSPSAIWDTTTTSRGVHNASGAASEGPMASVSAQLREERQRLQAQREIADAREAQLAREEEMMRMRQEDLRRSEYLRQTQQQQQQQQQPQQQASQLPPRFRTDSPSQGDLGLPPRPAPYGANGGGQLPRQLTPQPQGAGLYLDSSEQRASMSRPMASPAGSLALNASSQQSPRPLPPDGCAADPSGEHHFRPLSLEGQNLGLGYESASRPLAADAGSQPQPFSAAERHFTAAEGGSGYAQTTSVATHEERPVPGLKASRPFDGLPQTPSLRLATNSLGLGSPGSYADLGSRPLDPSGQMRYASSSTGAAAAGGPAQGFAAAVNDAALNRTPRVGPFTAQRMSEGPRPGGGGRSGMIVELPGTQAVNRNIAPNVSAVWREWTDPDGTTYFYHEPTRTLQRVAPGASEIETLVQGLEDIPPEHLRLRSHREEDTTVNVNTQTVRNLQSYAGGGGGDGRGVGTVRAPGVLRTEVLPPQPRGAHSPTRRAAMDALTAPRFAATGYQGQRLHRLTLRPGDEPGQAVVAHQVQTLDSDELTWDRTTGAISTRDPSRQGPAGAATLHRQWEHVRKVLCQGRYFKKHALRTDSDAFRFVFLTGDNAYVCCVPTSQVMINVSNDPRTFGTAADTIQYYGQDTRAMAVNSITHVCLGADEPMVARRRSLNPQNTFVIVGRTHALILECNTRDEAQFWCDAWNFFLDYSRPVNPKATRTPQMTAPVTYGTRGGLAF